MKLEDVIRTITITDRRGHFDAEIRTITSDSRRVGEGDVFVAVRGREIDGHDFIPDALRRGARAVVAEDWPEELDDGLGHRPNVILVEDTRRALAVSAAHVFGDPSKDLQVAGVTGTNGKTTVAHVLEAILAGAGKQTGVIGTTGARYPGKVVPLQHTTPDPVTMQGLLARMHLDGVTHVVMEVSSHALDQQRVRGVHLKVAGFTNLTQDHLDYHGDMERYFAAKARLFTEVLAGSAARGRMAVVNIDDPRGPELIELWGGKALTVSLSDTNADLHVSEVEYGLSGTRAVVESDKGAFDVEVALIGAHNLSNVLVAIGMAEAMGLPPSRAVTGLTQLGPAPGRLEPVPSDEGKRVFVDYAHTPDALEQVLASLRPLVSSRLIVVFGCGGDRDAEKRPLMGKAVAQAADLAVVTSDNPRNEDPAEIATSVETGLKEAGWSRIGTVPAPRTFQTELDRRRAIEVAIGWMEPGDVLVIAGKGHEQTQTMKGVSVPFDDREEARRVLADLPPAPPPPPSPPPDVEGTQVIESIDIEPDVVEVGERSGPAQLVADDDVEREDDES